MIAARPAAGFMAALDSSPAATPSLIPVPISRLPGAPEDLPPDSDAGAVNSSEAETFHLTSRPLTPVPGKLPFGEREITAHLEQQTMREVAAALMDPPRDAAGHLGCSADDVDGGSACNRRSPVLPRSKPSRQPPT